MYRSIILLCMLFFAIPANAESCRTNLSYEQNIAQAKNNALMVITPTMNGSAVVWNEHFIITNFHVIKNAQHITLRDAWNRSYPTHVIAASPAEDLAILSNTTPLQRNMWWTGRNAQPGELIIAVGNPLGRGFASSTGQIVNITTNHRTESALHQTLIVAGINLQPGMSGGPVYNEKGCFVGISTAKSQRYGYIIPTITIINMLRRFGY
jgi:serine protease Do